jgi:hypothetical protein
MTANRKRPELLRQGKAILVELFTCEIDALSSGRTLAGTARGANSIP